MSTMFVYWILKCDSIIWMVKSFRAPVEALLVISLILFVISWIIQGIARSDDCGSASNDIKKADVCAKVFRSLSYKILSWSLPLWIILTLAAGLIPTTKEMAIIYVVPKVVNNTQVQRIPGKIMKLAEDWMDELSPSNIKKNVSETLSDTSKKQ